MTRSRIAVERVLRAREAMKREQIDEARQQRGWWGRITNRTAESDILTEEELNFIEEEISKVRRIRFVLEN